jgi:hypothetical protein
MFNVRKVGMISSACIGNGRQGRLLLERPWSDSKTKEGTVQTSLDS